MIKSKYSIYWGNDGYGYWMYGRGGGGCVFMLEVWGVVGVNQKRDF